MRFILVLYSILLFYLTLSIGNYVFYDWMQSELKACTVDEIAVTVLTRGIKRRHILCGFFLYYLLFVVIGHYPKRNQFLIDAGALALSSDLGCTHLRDGSQYVSHYTPLLSNSLCLW